MLQPPVLTGTRTGRVRLASKARRVLLGLHRDVGFLLFGLTIVYAVSGIAVNHRDDWDYNHSTEEKTYPVGRPEELLRDLPSDRLAAISANPAHMTEAEEQLLVARVGERLGRRGPPRNAFWRGPAQLAIYYAPGDRDTAEYRLDRGEVRHVRQRERPLLRDLNYLHLNEGRGLWTVLADAYAALLFFLAFSGILIVRGRKGLRGRGGWLLGLGVALPLAALVWLRYL